MACYLLRFVTNSPWLLLFVGLLAYQGCAYRKVIGQGNPQGINNMGYDGTQPMGGSGGGGFGGGGTGHFGGVFDSPPPMPVGCPSKYNFGLCEMTLLQNACVAKHPESSKGMTAEDACDKVWPKTMLGSLKKMLAKDKAKDNAGREALNLYCLAAASDQFLLSKVNELTADVPSDPALCKVADMDHLQVHSSILGNPVERIEKAETRLLLQKYGMPGMPGAPNPVDVAVHFGQPVSPELLATLTPGVGIYAPALTDKIQKICQEYGKKVSELPDQYGLCHRGAAKEGAPAWDLPGTYWDPQDCDFFKDIKEAWSKNYGEEKCNAFPDAKKFRCLALRKQIIRTAQHKSVLKVAKFTKFGNLTKTKEFKRVLTNCPEN